MIHIASSKRFPSVKRTKYRKYSANSLTDAYTDVKDGKLSVAKAARKYNIPEQTLRDRTLGHVDAESFKSGPAPIFDVEQEVRLVNHIKYMESIGYGYTRSEVVDLGTEYAVHLGLRTKEKQLSLKWFYGLMNRWPELKIWRPKTISDLRAKATSKESIAKYFEELNKILHKYNLLDKPQNIYNVDEKGISQNFTPPQIVGSVDHVPHVITSEKSATTTILGCGSAYGQQIPPYFVFQGARMRQELLEGAIPGTDGDVSPTGWSNSGVFQSYLENHFIKYAVGSHVGQKILLLYDGHRTHITPDIIDWAIDMSVVLFVLPPHTSHILQPMDVGCFGPFTKIYSSECTSYQRVNSTVINGYNICSLACKAYLTALSPANLQSAFRRSGIYPFNPEAIDTSLFPISDNLKQTSENHVNSSTVINLESVQFEETTDLPEQPQMPIRNDTAELTEQLDIEMATEFFDSKTQKILSKPKSKPRRSIHKILAGKAITEPDTRAKIIEYINESAQSKSKAAKSQGSNRKSTSKSCKPNISANKCSTKTSKEQMQPSESRPGPSGKQKIIISDTSSDSDSQIQDDEKCCVCHLFQPKELKHCISVVFTKWGGCEYDGCKHWTHLKYCCDVSVLRRHDKFYCPCHGLPCKQVEE